MRPMNTTKEKFQKEKLRNIFFEMLRSHKNHNDVLNDIKHNFKRYLVAKRIDSQSIDLFAYEPFQSEVNIIKILNHMKFRHIYVPKIRGRGLLFKSLTSNQCIPNYRADLIIVPALFVQHDGYRLGRGGGYYDRLLRFFPRQKKVFLGYDWQVRDQISIEQHDQKISMIITDQRIINCYSL